MKYFHFADLLCICGLGLMGYGLWIYEPWVSYTVTGGTLFSTGVLSAFIRGTAGTEVEQ